MTWSYNLADLATSAKDQVRLAIGDTLTSDQQLQDEEITQFLAGRSTIAGACADACRALAAKFSRSVDYAAGMTRVKYSDMAKAYLVQAIGFDAQAVRAGSGLPYAGGISVQDKINQQQDTDRVQPQFNLGLDDNNIVPIGPAGNQTEQSAQVTGDE